MKVIERFKTKIKKAQNIVITTHLFPDADGIGSQVALCLALRSLGKNAICVNEEQLLDRYRYLDPQNVLISLDDYQKRHAQDEVDLFIVTDTNSLSRSGEGINKIAQHSKDLLFVDHHPCPKEIMAIHCIDTSKAATGELVGNLIESIDVEFTRDMAMALYTAILIDTSSFRYPTVTGHTHQLIGKLMNTGITPAHAYNMIYGTKKLNFLKLLGRVLTSAHTTKDEKIAWITLSEDSLEKYHVDVEDTHALINNLLILENIKVACMFREMGHQIKLSLRSTGEVDVGAMARSLGGGGHDHSAATIIEGKLQDVVNDCVNKLQSMLEEVEKN